MRFVIKLLVSSFAVVISSYLLRGVEVANFTTAIIVAFVLAILNALLKPLLIVLTIPVTILSLGLFLLVINAFIIQLVDYFVGDGFIVATFWWALIFSIILSFVSWLLELPIKSNDRRELY